MVLSSGMVLPVWLIQASTKCNLFIYFGKAKKPMLVKRGWAGVAALYLSYYLLFGKGSKKKVVHPELGSARLFITNYNPMNISKIVDS